MYGTLKDLVASPFCGRFINDRFSFTCGLKIVINEETLVGSRLGYPPLLSQIEFIHERPTFLPLGVPLPIHRTQVHIVRHKSYVCISHLRYSPQYSLLTLITLRKQFLIKSQLPPRPSKNYSKLVIWCCDDIFQKQFELGSYRVSSEYTKTYGVLGCDHVFDVNRVHITNSNVLGICCDVLRIYSHVSRKCSEFVDVSRICRRQSANPIACRAGLILI